jgi:proline iminopeptidase
MKQNLLFAVLALLIAICAPEGRCETLKASDGAVLVYERHGSGPACIFVHGGPGQGYESFRRMGGNKLEAFFDLTYLDQRGSGHSPDSNNYHLARIVEDIDDLRKRLGLSRVCLVAHSFGGIIANAYARAHPRRVTGLVMINTTLHFLSPDTLRLQISEMSARMGLQQPKNLSNMTREQLMEVRDSVRATFNKTERPYSLFTDHLETVQKMNCIDSGYMRHRGFGDAVMARPTAYTEYFESQVGTTPYVSVPVLVIAGRHDYMVGPTHHVTYRYPHATVRSLECGHLPFFDCQEAFVAAVRDFREAHL